MPNTLRAANSTMPLETKVSRRLIIQIHIRINYPNEIAK